MRVTIDEARRIAELAHLDAGDEVLARLAGEMTEILDYIDQLRQAPLDASAADADEATVLREDIARPSTPRDLVETNAPQWSDGFFVVPRVIGE